MTDQEVASSSSSNNLMSSYAEIVAAFQIIRTLRIENLKLNPDVFSTPLYRDTIMYREPDQAEFIGDNEILMKNVYYIATLTENVSDAVVDQLLASKILTEEDCTEIRSQPTNKLRCVKMFALLVGKEDPDNNILARILTTLKESGNGNVVGLLQTFFGNENQDNAGGINDEHHPDGAHGGGIENNEEVGKWTCRFCTFQNNAESNICEVCARTDNSDSEDIIDVVFCPRCTLVNTAGTNECTACEFIFNEDSDSDDEDNELNRQQLADDD